MFKISKNIFKNVYLSHKIISSSYNPKLLYSDMCKVYEKSFQVHPGFGNINLKSNCYCIVLPADPQLFPDSNHVQVVVWRKSVENVDPKVNIEISGNKDYIRAEIEAASLEYLCQLFIPFKYDVEAVMENAAPLDVENLESDEINITSSKGSVKAKNIKTEQLSVTMKEASLSLDGAFQGNLNVNAKKLNFRAKRLQGTNLFIQASSLETDIESSYMTNGNIFAERGNLNIKNLHGSTYLHLLKGNLSVNGLHGTLQTIVNEGKLDVHINEVIEDSLIQLEKGI
ncbi:hypothetical protein Anas_13379 [Armadillidium nasatum]|uniref:Adhesin domain-containing protein n=1 Tax=Armadillidium nasatum TaxID=96803 RepID=A0A5N5T2C4_9CRUS|nr:hypothetical protein Anas_13379 [Armadillidium nasatum]